MKKDKTQKLSKITAVVKDLNIFYIVRLDWEVNSPWPERLTIPELGITATFADSYPKYLLYERDLF